MCVVKQNRLGKHYASKRLKVEELRYIFGLSILGQVQTCLDQRDWQVNGLSDADEEIATLMYCWPSQDARPRDRLSFFILHPLKV